MKKFSNFVVKNKRIIVIISLFLLIPSIIGLLITKTNYDILVYLPSDIETLKGQKILEEDFNMGAFSVSLVDNGVSNKDLAELEKKIREIDCVNEVISINDITGTIIPIEMLPKKLIEKVSSKDSKLLLITFTSGTVGKATVEKILVEFLSMLSGKGLLKDAENAVIKENEIRESPYLFWKKDL